MEFCALVGPGIERKNKDLQTEYVLEMQGLKGPLRIQPLAVLVILSGIFIRLNWVRCI